MSKNSIDYSKLFHLSPFPQWVFELATFKILDVNDAAVKHYGYSKEEWKQLTLQDLQSEEEVLRFLKAYTDLSSNDENIYFGDFTHQKKSGEKIRMKINGHNVDLLDKKCVLVMCQDATEQMNKEREKELLSKISLDFSIENDLITSANALCETISTYGKFDFVELWLPNVEHTHIQLFAHKSNSSNAGIFYDFTKNVQSIHLGKGLQGAAWLKKSSILWEDLEKNKDFIRNEAAGKAGIKTALGIPLFWAKQVVGILIIGTRHQIDYLNKYLLVFEQLEQFIGSEISRKKLENDLHHLYQAIPDILCLSDLQGRFLKINKAGRELLGYSKEEILSHSLEEFVHPQDKDLSTNAVIKLGEGQTIFNFENRFLTKNGDIIWLSWTCSSSIEEGLIYATAKNITEEKKLRELNRQVNSMAKIGYWELDLMQGKMYWSDMIHALHETDPISFAPDVESAINFYREDFREMVQTSIDKCIQAGVVFDFEAIIVTTKGKERWVRTMGSAEIENDQCKRIYGGFQDIHNSKSLELQIREILGSISDAFYAIDKDWKFTYFNNEAERLLSKKAEDVIGHNIWQQFPAAIGTPLQNIYYRVARLEKPETFEYLYPGDGKWYEINAYPSQGGVSAYFRNIDERKLAAEKIEKAYQEKTDILESIGDAFFSVNKNWIVTYWNKEAEIVLGKKRRDIVGRHLWTEYSEAIDGEFYRQYHKAMETGETANFEEYHPTLGKWLEVSAYPTPNSLSIYFKDTTLRKEADIRLTQANERFEKVTQATNDAIWDWDIENKTFFRSNGIEKFFGVQASTSLVDEDFWKDNFHPEDLPKVQQSIQKAIDDPGISKWEEEYRILKENGEVCYVMDKGLIIRNKNGKAVRIVGAMTNISERKKHEAELLDLNETLKKHARELELTNDQLEQFAFITSHDLQEPLRMITSFLDQLKRKYGGQLDDKAHQYIHFATDGAKRMKQIILDLLEYSRAGKLEENRVKINLDQLVTDYKSLRKKIIYEKSVLILHPPFPVIEGYRAPCTQVIHCLLDNAIKYSREGIAPRIELGVEETESEWVFSVRDNGIGIAPEFNDKIFVIFQRLHNRNQYDGNGIGLSIVKKQVETWGGSVWLKSTVGEGSVFYFTLPKNNKSDEI